jgi:hypothetical protein
MLITVGVLPALQPQLCHLPLQLQPPQLLSNRLIA